MFLEIIFAQGLNGIRITVTTHISKIIATAAIIDIQLATNSIVYPYSWLCMGVPYGYFM